MGKKKKGFTFKSDSQRAFFEMKIRALIGEERRAFVSWLCEKAAKTAKTMEENGEKAVYDPLGYDSLKSLAERFGMNPINLKHICEPLASGSSGSKYGEPVIIIQDGDILLRRGVTEEEIDGKINGQVKVLARMHKSSCGDDALLKSLIKGLQ